LVISIGFAGALQESLKVGDLLLAETLQPSDSPGEIRIDPELMQQALRVPVPDGVSRIPGRLVTVGEPVSLPGKKQELGRRHSAQAVDMETAPLARLAQEQQLPFLSVRAISDTLNQALFDISPLLKPEGEVSPLKAGWFVLTHPGSLKSLVRLRDQAHRARQNLTRFLSSWMATMTP
ncbi:MAG: hypothetical protein GWM98_02755, partial [Nitrospinaceae bacterium]|nr:hypothetical protein [Nitrospinaceae bacterium]NIR55919.1 hypothetical protein [Nitrospinaceae bacterium]NIS86366.1 hypothetical protein [Nitrospinaceae bacterium]NIT80828.1 hypothetical protein [Nitrospinaceae bacterium]NIU45413.1 hypothetical protein [Nitrospinaceae bacterium]